MLAMWLYFSFFFNFSSLINCGRHNLSSCYEKVHVAPSIVFKMFCKQNWQYTCTCWQYTCTCWQYTCTCWQYTCTCWQYTCTCWQYTCTCCLIYVLNLCVAFVYTVNRWLVKVIVYMFKCIHWALLKCLNDIGQLTKGILCYNILIKLFPISKTSIIHWEKCGTNNNPWCLRYFNGNYEWVR